jgi:hypothetical protein
LARVKWQLVVSSLISYNNKIMKNLRFVLGLCIGVLIGVLFSIIVKCESEEPEATQQIQNSCTLLKDIDSYAGEVYKLTVDNIQYLVVVNNRNSSSSIAIIKHQ